MIMKKLQDLFQISDAATADLGRGILACTLMNVVMLLFVLVVVLVFQEILARSQMDGRSGAARAGDRDGPAGRRRQPSRSTSQSAMAVTTCGSTWLGVL